MQMRGNLHRYRVSPSRKKNRMLQGTFLPSYSPVLKNAGYGLLLTLLGALTLIYIAGVKWRNAYIFLDRSARSHTIVSMISIWVFCR